MLKGDWREAVRLIMQPHESEKEDSAQARRLYLDGGDAEGALKAMPKYLAGERAILEVVLFSSLRTKDETDHTWRVHEVAAWPCRC